MHFMLYYALFKQRSKLSTLDKNNNLNRYRHLFRDITQKIRKK